MPKANPHIARMAPYALAEIATPPGKPLISLSQNESLRPPSPRALKAAADAARAGALYPDPECHALREALAGHHDIPASDILCGNGSLDLIGCLARAYAGPDASVLAPAHAYPFFRTAAQTSAAPFLTAPETAHGVDIDALLAAIRPDTSIVFVANPGNPTGTRVPRAELKRLRDGLRGDILLVVDEAYGEFADHLQESSWDMVRGGNTAVLRTFSKAYGLAGFRLGWGLFPDPVARELRKIINPNAVTHPSQAAALAALEDQDYMVETCALTARARDRARSALKEAGFDVAPSHTNFLLIPFADEAAAMDAERALQREGIILRRQQGAGLPHALRMTIAEEAAMAAAITQLRRWKEEDRP